MPKNNVEKFRVADFFSRLFILCFAVVLLAGCAKSDPLSERARLKPLLLAAQAGDDAAFKKLEAEVQRGVPEAMNQMGIYYYQKYIAMVEEEQGRPEADFFSDDKYPFYKKALALWEQAALRGNAPAAYNLARQYVLPYNFREEEQRKISDVDVAKWHRVGAELGDPASMIKLWDIFWRDKVNSKAMNRPNLHVVSDEEGPKWLQRAGDMGTPEAIWWLALWTGSVSSKSNIDSNPLSGISVEEAFFWKHVLITYYPDYYADASKLPDDEKYQITQQQKDAAKKRVKNWRPVRNIWPSVTKKAVKKDE